MLEALNEPNLDARVAKGLPWLALTYVDMVGTGWFGTRNCTTVRTDWDLQYLSGK